MENIPSLDPDYDLWLLLLKVNRGIFKVREKELAKFGITPEQASVLYACWVSNGKATIAKMSRAMLRERHTVAGLVDRMERKGLVTKVRDLDRNNVFRVTLTDKGEQALQQSVKTDSIHRIMSVLTREERPYLNSYLQSLLDASLEELDNYYTHPFSNSSQYFEA